MLIKNKRMQKVLLAGLGVLGLSVFVHNYIKRNKEDDSLCNEPITEFEDAFDNVEDLYDEVPIALLNGFKTILPDICKVPKSFTFCFYDNELDVAFFIDEEENIDCTLSSKEDGTVLCMHGGLFSD